MKLLKDRNLNIAILISVSCHLIGIFSIVPILSSGRIYRNPARISFFGSILERVIAVPERSFNLPQISFMDKIERMRNRTLQDSVLGLPPEFTSKSIATMPDKEKFWLSESGQKTGAYELHYAEKKKFRIGVKDMFLSGEAKNRIILYKPELRKLAALSWDFNSGYIASISFNVSEHGFVENVKCLVSSGSSEIDELAVRYVRRWQFVPWEDEVIGELQQGIIRVDFNNLSAH